MASSDIINELVWHFAGYLRVPPGDNFTVKVLYEGRGGTVVGQDDDNANRSSDPSAGYRASFSART